MDKYLAQGGRRPRVEDVLGMGHGGCWPQKGAVG